MVDPGDKPVEVEIEYEPALNTEAFFESFFKLGRDGKTTANGAPRFGQLVVMARHFKARDVRWSRSGRNGRRTGEEWRERPAAQRPPRSLVLQTLARRPWNRTT